MAQRDFERGCVHPGDLAFAQVGLLLIGGSGVMRCVAVGGGCLGPCGGAGEQGCGKQSKPLREGFGQRGHVEAFLL